MEAKPLYGISDTAVSNVIVSQGYSNPRAFFSVSPDSANILTVFTFNATATQDDEDSLSCLLFRWDFDGDGNWDTEFGNDSIITHRYQENMDYKPKMEVKDPKGLLGLHTGRVKVTRWNDQIKPIFDWSCGNCTIEDNYIFDASGSYSLDNQGSSLLFSWDIMNDGMWEKKLDLSPIFSARIPAMGKTPVKLRVTDNFGLYMDMIDSVDVYNLNEPPITVLSIANRLGNNNNDVFITSFGSWDRGNSTNDLSFMWDINNDNKFEEYLRDLQSISIRFEEPGQYLIKLRVIDPQGKFTEESDTLWIF